MSSRAGIKGFKIKEVSDGGTFSVVNSLRGGDLSLEEKESMAYRKILRHFLFRGLQSLSARRSGCV